MSYNNAIPQATDDPSASQPQILANFEEIATLIAVNHVAFNDSDQGKHAFLQMPEQSSAPATAANEGGLYTKEISSATQLFYREESSGNELQLTNALLGAAVGYFEVPGGILVKWGNGSFASGATVTFDSTVPFSTVYSVVAVRDALTASSQAIALGVGSRTATNFRVFYNGVGPISILYIAIGKK